jgi:hypothetical protein
MKQKKPRKEGIDVFIVSAFPFSLKEEFWRCTMEGNGCVQI